MAQCCPDDRHLFQRRPHALPQIAQRKQIISKEQLLGQTGKSLSGFARCFSTGCLQDAAFSSTEQSPTLRPSTWRNKASLEAAQDYLLEQCAGSPQLVLPKLSKTGFNLQGSDHLIHFGRLASTNKMYLTNAESFRNLAESRTNTWSDEAGAMSCGLPSSISSSHRNYGKSMFSDQELATLQSAATCPSLVSCIRNNSTSQTSMRRRVSFNDNVEEYHFSLKTQRLDLDLCDAQGSRLDRRALVA